MRLLLDTHIALWLPGADRRLPPRARSLIEEASSVHLSVVSILEVAIKRSLPIGRPDRPKLSASELFNEMEAAGVELLSLAPEHAFAVESLPLHHGDPFDRLLVAQAIHEPMHLLTRDAMLARYSDIVIVV